MRRASVSELCKTLPNAMRLLLLITLAAIANQSLADDWAREKSQLKLRCRQLESQLAQAKTDEQKVAATVKMCRLFVEVAEHEALPKSSVLQEINVRVRSRLRSKGAQFSKELKRRGEKQPKWMQDEQRLRRNLQSCAANLRLAKSHGQMQLVAQLTQRLNLLKRQLDALNVARSNRKDSGAVDSLSGDPGLSESGLSDAGPSDSDAGAFDSNSSGSASNWSKGQSGRAAGPPWNQFGWGLVHLIQQTVQPEYWETAGGVGKILYFGHSRALVVHGNWQVQEDVADMLGALRGEH